MSANDTAGRTILDRIAAGRLAGSARIGGLGNSVLSRANPGVYAVIQGTSCAAGRAGGVAGGAAAG